MLKMSPTAPNTNLPKCIANHLLNPKLTEVKLQTLHDDAVEEVLQFNMENQSQSKWCWAAVATSVGNYYFGEGSWTQCSVASGELDQDCCNNPGPCNIPYYLEKALAFTRSLNEGISGRLSMSDIEIQIDIECPISLRCAWYGGGAHFLVINGYGPDYINVADPIYGYSTQTLSSFPASYNGGGDWTHTYFTQKN
ncbi:papain-like cysteine protease family protein [Xenorhabdus budapestensis]|uniref:Peptidase C39-like domain-containing protein n=1 Tax=Xenorhabdus budapestensis TaxID=290110 RepID=A0A2D0IWF3_XENBU|nr:papain-like cysteine protease family protein [Xenorhabdus budapestensis]PHM26097.1 hypothetical protein Xbud_02743 [Xenorhabdus budapestensis]